MEKHQANTCPVLYISIMLIIKNLNFIHRKTDDCFSTHL